jgi:hypothetical protein
MLTARDLNDSSSPRIRAHLDEFRAAAPPAPESSDPMGGDWAGWAAIMATRTGAPDDGWEAGMTVVSDFEFETVSSSLIALPNRAKATQTARDEPPLPIWLFAPGRPDRQDYRRIPLEAAG